ncbi:MAG: aminoacyl-tRNA hydrolase [Pirellulaceae bacterium]|nr:aminoacyl-tRNA hydrolase [Planctomycetales bacterium]
MKLVVGLGNPGKKYEGTRHNVGFDVIDELRRRHGFGGGKSDKGKTTVPGKSRFSGETFEATWGSEKILLLQPTTFMNLSGKSVVAAKDFYKLELEDILVICDDFQLPLGRLRIRKTGSSGGQKGLEDCIRRLGSPDFPRLRLGIGPVPAQWEVVDFVLGQFDKSLSEEVKLMVVRAADAVEAWVTGGVTEAANRYNGV